jgi:hypothetical protein
VRLHPEVSLAGVQQDSVLLKIATDKIGLMEVTLLSVQIYYISQICGKFPPSYKFLAILCRQISWNQFFCLIFAKYIQKKQ